VADRSNVIIHYPGTSDKIVSFVGSHMDTVPADPEQWSRDPFQLERDGDKIYGRGVTDCLGHVALLACVFKKLAQLRPTLERGVVAVLIAKYVLFKITRVLLLFYRGICNFLECVRIVHDIFSVLKYHKCIISFSLFVFFFQ
jgi:hypothetical protein